MEPLSLLAIGITALACSAAGYGLGTWRERRTAPTTKDYQELEAEHKRLQGRETYLVDRVHTRNRDIVDIMAQRDKYRAMAETHDIQIPETVAGTVQTGTLWEGRLYSNHPETNLKHMAAEFKAAGVWDKEVHIRLEIIGSAMGGAGGFAKAIHGTWTKDGKPTKNIGPWMFHGTGERALNDIFTFLRDDDTGLTKTSSKSKKKEWVDDDSPLVFKLDVSVTELIEPRKPPEIQIVEVAVVEERVVERVIEKEVFISIPAGREPELCGHTAEEIRAVVDEALARKVADAEVARLEGLVKAPETRADLQKRMLAQEAAKKPVGSGG